MGALRRWKKCKNAFCSLSSLSVEAPHCLGTMLTADPEDKDFKTLCFVIKFYLFFVISPQGKFTSCKPYCHHTTGL